MLWKLISGCLLVFALIGVVACGGDDDDGASSTGSPTPTVAPVPGGGVLEGPGRPGTVNEQTDFREDPNWQLPAPADIPAADDGDDPIQNPPDEPVCPEGWAEHVRAREGFEICYPADWTIGGHGYNRSANEESWYSVGFFSYPVGDEENQLAHVSVYVVPQYTRPFRYTIDCPQPYSLEFAGEPAVVCPDFPPTEPEARISSYHVFRENLDYFVTVASYREWDAEAGEYTDGVNQEAVDTAIQIAHSLTFIPVAVEG